MAAVQLQIRQSDLRSFEAFRSRIDALVERCMAFEPDLIVFPEYTSVFFALIPYYPMVAASESALEGLARVGDRDALVGDFRDLFLLNSGLASRGMDEVFATLARKHGVAIIPGTYFAWDRRGQEVVLVNRVVVYEANGEIAYRQDKVFLTPFEEQVLGLSPGRLEQAEPFELRGRRIGITICRDTFFSDWLQVYQGIDLWIDIKADGAASLQEQRRRFLQALPARMDEGNIHYGLTVCLTGSLLDMLWTGQSSLARKNRGEMTRFVEEASSATEEEILFVSIGGRPASD